MVRDADKSHDGHGAQRSNSPSAHLSHRIWQRIDASGLLIPLAYFAFLLQRAPHLDPRDWDYDEGINLMKTLLYQRGFQLYSEVWNDQPPLFTVLLGLWTELFGSGATAPRLLMMLFAALLLWTLTLCMRTQLSMTATAVALLLLIISEYFIRLSGAVMVGLPSMTIAALAVMTLLLRPDRLWSLVVSALLAALALQTKLISAVIAPTVLLLLLFPGVAGIEARQRLSRGRRLLRTALYGSIVAILYVAIGLYYGALEPQQLLISHFSQQVRDQVAFVRESSQFMPNFYRQHAIHLLIAACGLYWAGRQRRLDVLIPLTWFASTWLALSFHRPLWYHHVMLLTVPLAWLVAYGVEWWVQLFHTLNDAARNASAERRAGVLIASALIVLAGATMLPSSLEQRQKDQSRVNRPNYIPEIADYLLHEAPQASEWVFTDHPFYAARAGLAVPPPIAVLSRKRLESGAISEETMLAVLNDYQPRYIILERFTYSYGANFMDVVNSRYDLVVESDPGRVYRLKSGL